MSYILQCVLTGSDRGEPRSTAAKSGAAQKSLPIEVPSISLDELKDLTGDFGSQSLIGEGSYGKVYHAKMSDGQEIAIKRLDSSQDQESDFTAQVRLCPANVSIEAMIFYSTCLTAIIFCAVVHRFTTKA